jgi:hypothetical protein
MYADGQGVPQNYVEAVKWFRLAADQGAAAAQYNVGHMYDKGYGVTKDDVEATRWWQLAADQDYTWRRSISGPYTPPAGAFRKTMSAHTCGSAWGRREATKMRYAI